MDKKTQQKKLPGGRIVLDSNNKRYLIFANTIHFYDLEYNLLHKEPALKFCNSVQIIDADTYMFTYTILSRKIVFYSFSQKKIIDTITITDKGLSSVCHALFCKGGKYVIFYGEYNFPREDPRGRVIKAYDTVAKTCVELVNSGSSLSFEHKEKYYFFNGPYFLVFKDDLSFENIPIEKNIHYAVRFDSENAMVVPFEYPNYGCQFQYYGHGDLDYCIDLNGKIQPWTPPKNPFETKMEKGVVIADPENYIRKNGLTKEVFDNLEDEDIMHGGFFWADDKLSAGAKEHGIGFDKYTIENIDIFSVESILYFVGYFNEELLDEGIDAYFFNREEEEFDRTIKILTHVGATETAKIIEKGVKIMSGFDLDKEKDIEKMAAQHQKLSEQLTEDYVGLTLKYLRKNLNI